MRDEFMHFGETREKVLRAALEVVYERTISGTRMHLIADKAGMVQSNVHYYFKTKQDLLEGLQERVLEECYQMQREGQEECQDTLEGHLHVFFQQKRYLVEAKKEYDFAELNFIAHSKIDAQVQERFRESYSKWRGEIRRIIERFCPQLPQREKEALPYLAVSLLEGASIQALIEGEDFDAGCYFDAAESMVLQRILDGGARRGGVSAHAVQS